MNSITSIELAVLQIVSTIHIIIIYQQHTFGPGAAALIQRAVKACVAAEPAAT